MIEVNDLNKSFFTPAGELHILRGINLSVRDGEILGIIGASGAGKSTFLHILGTLDKPTSGKVVYNNIDVFSLKDNPLTLFRNQTIGFIFQFHHLLPEFTAIENVIMPGLILMTQKSGIIRRALQEKAAVLLDELGLAERKNHRPGELSGGEQQRIAVARALILEPKVILADEPTGNLDTETGEELLRLLLYLNSEKGLTFIIATHNESLSRRCHRVLKMADGKLNARDNSIKNSSY